MIKCNKCGRSIIYIPVSRDKSIKADVEEIEIYTITGRKVIGYKKHECKEEKNGN